MWGWSVSLEIAQELSSGRGLARAEPGKDTGVLRAVPSGRGMSPGWLARGWAVGGGRGSLLDLSCGQPPCRDRHTQATPQARGGWSFFSQGPQVWSLPRHAGAPAGPSLTSAGGHMDAAGPSGGRGAAAPPGRASCGLRHSTEVWLTFLTTAHCCVPGVSLFSGTPFPRP